MVSAQCNGLLISTWTPFNNGSLEGHYIEQFLPYSSSVLTTGYSSFVDEVKLKSIFFQVCSDEIFRPPFGYGGLIISSLLTMRMRRMTR